MSLLAYVKTNWINKIVGVVTGTKVNATNMNKIENGIEAVTNEVIAHVADNTHHMPHLGTTTNVGNAYSITSTEVIAANSKFSVKFNAASTGASTLNISSVGSAKGVKKTDGSDASLKAGVYNIFYDGINFQLLGEGGDIAKLTNLIKNGSFENDFNGWIQPGAAPTLETTGAIYQGAKCRRTASNAGSISYDYTTVVANSGDKLYMTGMFYPETYTSGTKAALTAYEFNGFSTYLGASIVNTSTLNAWQRLSLIVTATNGGVRVLAGRTGGGVENTRYDALMVINLTATFGAGQEPTVAEIDAMVMANSGNLFDKSKVISGYYATGTGLYVADANYKTSDERHWFKVGDNLTISGNGTTYIILYNEAGVYQGIVNSPTKTFTATYDGFCRVNIKVSDGSENTCQLEFGAVATTYKPYQKYGWWDSPLQQLTADATAVAGDITLGKIVYANGVQLTGTGANAKRFSNGIITNQVSGTVSGLLFQPKQITIAITSTGTFPEKGAYIGDFVTPRHTGARTNSNGGNFTQYTTAKCTPTADGFTYNFSDIVYPTSCNLYWFVTD